MRWENGVSSFCSFSTHERTCSGNCARENRGKNVGEKTAEKKRTRGEGEIDDVVVPEKKVFFVSIFIVKKERGRL